MTHDDLAWQVGRATAQMMRLWLTPWQAFLDRALTGDDAFDHGEGGGWPHNVVDLEAARARRQRQPADSADGVNRSHN